jgi:hypothetical protein
MKIKIVFGAFALVACTAFVSGTVLSDEKSDHEKAQHEMEKLAQPSEHHKHLEATVGHFKAHSKMWFEPGKPAVESDAESTNEWVLGGRFVKQTYKGTFMGQPFEGMGLSGYDNFKKKYVCTWVDTSSTSMMTTEGEGDGKTITAHGEVDEPSMPGKKTKVKTVTKIESNDKHTYEMFFTMPGQDKEAKVMEITYTRTK